MVETVKSGVYSPSSVSLSKLDEFLTIRCMIENLYISSISDLTSKPTLRSFWRTDIYRLLGNFLKVGPLKAEKIKFPMTNLKFICAY